ncbi:membrane-associated protein, putative [Bodo saltans]|uniref:Membrane-associated protein, putative n=1 Tax=Bodo saltans TaxID=75058 RepID=A0A0S4IXY9_BODSA|nr:membrane-associated protein, putative [Bodo saltans]|eukprot:CUG48691.1 membrane-associated protein, putative [Bodo saltans]
MCHMSRPVERLTLIAMIRCMMVTLFCHDACAQQSISCSLQTTGENWTCDNVVNCNGVGVASCAPWPQGCLCNCNCSSSGCRFGASCSGNSAAVSSDTCSVIFDYGTCSSSDCNNRATSVKCVGFSCRCTCSPEWTGATCSTPLTLCSVSLDCSSAGTNWVRGYRETGCTCSCKEGWYGSRCHCQIPQCSTIGTASSQLTSPKCFCLCKLGYAGATCSRQETMSMNSLSMSEVASEEFTSSVSSSHSPSKEQTFTYGSATLMSSTTDSMSAAITRSPSDTASGASWTDVLSRSTSATGSTSSEHTVTNTQNATMTQSTQCTTTSSISNSASGSRSQSISMAATHSLSFSLSGAISLSNSWTLSVTRTPSESRMDSSSETRTRTCSRSSTNSVSQSKGSHSRTQSSMQSSTPSFSSSDSFSLSSTLTTTTTVTDSSTLPITETVTISCPTTTRLTTSTSAGDLWPQFNDSTTGHLATRCYLQPMAEAILSNSTHLPCVPVFAEAEGGIVVYPATRGPIPPFLLAIPHSFDSNWVLRLPYSPSELESENASLATSFILRDNISGSGSDAHFDNKTNLTTSFGTLFLLVRATAEWQSSITVPLEAACGRAVVGAHDGAPASAGLHITVTWPQKQFGILNQVMVGLVSGGSTVSGNPTAAAALAMVGLLSCSGSTPALQSAGYFVSLFFDLGAAAVAAGNVGIIAIVVGLQFAAVRVWMWRHKITSTDIAMADLRFPALSIFIAMYLLPGAVYGSVASVSSGDSVVTGLLVLLIVIALVVGSQVFLIKVVLPVSDFRPYPIPHKTAYFFERFALLPSSRWIPESAERRFMPLMGTRTKEWCLLSIADLLLALCLSAATGLGVGTHGASCSVMPIVVASIYFLNAAIVVVLRPHRRPMDRVAFPIIWTLFGVMCILKYLTASEDLIDTLQSVLSFVQLWQTVCALLVFVRERQWRQQILEDKSLPIDDVYPSVGKTLAHDEVNSIVGDGNAFLSDEIEENDGLEFVAGFEVEAEDDGLLDFWFDIERFAIDDEDDSDGRLDDLFGDHRAAAPLEPIFSENDVHRGIRLLKETELVVGRAEKLQLHNNSNSVASYISIAEGSETQPESMIMSAPVFTQRNHDGK